MKNMISSEFKKNLKEIDPFKIEALKGAAVRALATYLMMESSSKDARFKKNADEFVEKERSTISSSSYSDDSTREL